MMKARYPFIDLVYGTHNLYRLPEYIYRVLTEKHPVVEVIDTDCEVVEGMPEKRRNRFNAFVNIMYGCNNFCTYCIVPYVRGRERSRTPEAVIAECVRLQDEGAQEIMLLGQNVNSYRGGGAAFAELLYRIDRLGIPRIRFMTSHPKDLSDELIHAFGELTHLMPQLHLPVQAGSDEILKRMNRSYTREHYLDLVHRLRSVCPEIGLTSDIIVGFPGETLEQFEETMSLIRQVRFDAAYTFIYSPRKGTKAATYPDDTPYEVNAPGPRHALRPRRLRGEQGRRGQRADRAICRCGNHLCRAQHAARQDHQTGGISNGRSISKDAGIGSGTDGKRGLPEDEGRRGQGYGKRGGRPGNGRVP